LNRNGIPHDDLVSVAVFHVRDDEIEVPCRPAADEVDTPIPRGTAMRTEASTKLRTSQDRFNGGPLDKIAMLVQGLTYGAMIELSDAIWNLQSEGTAVTRENLPALLHRWSTSRSSMLDDAAEEIPPE
jgi:hypothetical protein